MLGPILIGHEKSNRSVKLLCDTVLDHCLGFPIDTGRKLNVHKTFRRRPGRLTYVRFISSVYGVEESIEEYK